jgi:hypothetical protein
VGRRQVASLPACIAFVVVVTGSRDAGADVTSWMAVGGGAAQTNRDTSSRDIAGTLTYSIGVGSSPLSRVVLGGLLRGTTMFGFGTDVGLAVRAATGGFARGNWGVAMDAGALWRSWGGTSYGDWPLQGVITFGSPWGLQVAIAAQVWSVSGGVEAQGLIAALELDLLRLTVMRQGDSERWWPNPAPAGGHEAASTPATFVRW